MKLLFEGDQVSTLWFKCYAVEQCLFNGGNTFQKPNVGFSCYTDFVYYGVNQCLQPNTNDVFTNVDIGISGLP